MLANFVCFAMSMANIEFSALTDYVTKRLNDEEAQSGRRRLCADCAATPAVFKTELLFSVVVWGAGGGGTAVWVG